MGDDDERLPSWVRRDYDPSQLRPRAEASLVALSASLALCDIEGGVHVHTVHVALVGAAAVGKGSRGRGEEV